MAIFDLVEVVNSSLGNDNPVRRVRVVGIIIFVKRDQLSTEDLFGGEWEAQIVFFVS